jgi:hypothetical protein
VGRSEVEAPLYFSHRLNHWIRATQEGNEILSVRTQGTRLLERLRIRLEMNVKMSVMETVLKV